MPPIKSNLSAAFFSTAEQAPEYCKGKRIVMNRVLKIIHASYAYERGIYGSGIPVAILDTGIYPHQAARDRYPVFSRFCGRTEKVL